jgi:SARP family transcriptional regulator, regulator of embCAB operon
VRYELLGPLRITENGTHRTITAPKIETLLATLLIKANQVILTEELIGEIWGSTPPARARAALHVYISQLRKKIIEPQSGGAVIRTHSQGYILAVDCALVDVTALQALHATGREHLDTDPMRALASFTEATRLFRGPVLSGIRNGMIINGFARWADETRLECLEAIAHISLRTGRHREVVSDLANWVDEHPLHEKFREQLMLALHLSGRRADALKVFHAARLTLREELGLEPGETLRKLQNAILHAGKDYAIAS